jgi:hypothetical protein
MKSYVDSIQRLENALAFSITQSVLEDLITS